MINLKDATKELHTKAERMPFNKKMMKGELSNEDYARYLVSQYHIFHTLEKNFDLPHMDMRRVDSIIEDLKELGFSDHLETFKGEETTRYCKYLNNLPQVDADAHIYLNYLAHMFGGQIIKKNLPGSGKLYEFENVEHIIGSVRRIQTDEWAPEVNKAFTYIINIFDELDES